MLYHTQYIVVGNVNILGGHSIGHSKQNVYVHMSYWKNSFRDSAISLYSRKIVAKLLLRIVCNIGTYCLSDKICIFYPLRYIIQNSTVNSHAFYIL